ncbi:hypothetical protein [Enterococcus gallinarum]|uniref:hypothetical protein n=1 Tax=Enterococcus gallinarum TaxID=1353 RepID=UPI0012E11FB1|nr:hypothetical protein [Enterococcus gallinarum]MBO6419027.1 hypothetical protein [Enterococcus gallinarum]MBO6420428.1 hypothetical protein [Enterococcus gallinarum]MDT2695857.1 hypothetical protein [Enterococcus gallinarum]
MQEVFFWKQISLWADYEKLFFVPNNGLLCLDRLRIIKTKEKKEQEEFFQNGKRIKGLFLSLSDEKDYKKVNHFKKKLIKILANSHSYL